MISLYLALFRCGQVKTIHIHQTAEVFDDHEHPGIVFPAYRRGIALPPPGRPELPTSRPSGG
eukprot:6192903-Alexandrium_andersonii.AAC.1